MMVILIMIVMMMVMPMFMVMFMVMLMVMDFKLVWVSASACITHNILF